MTDRLSEKEIDCLRGVGELKSSKAIARDLGISPHTVDSRLKRAINKLNAADRFEAARLFQATEAPDASGTRVRTLAYQTSEVPEPPRNPPEASSSSDGIWNKDSDTTRLRDNAFAADWTHRSSYFPIPTYRGERNGLTGLQRLGWIVAIAVGSVVIFGGLMGGLSALSTLFS